MALARGKDGLRAAAVTGANALDRADGVWRFRIALSVVLLLACMGGGLSSLTASASAACANESFRTGPSAGLPDCRVYEQVTPAEKGGGEGVIGSSLEESFAEASPTGERIYYESLAPFPDAPGNTLYAGHLSTHSTTSGWQTTELIPAKSTPYPASKYVYAQYEAFSPDLSEVVFAIPDDILAEGATAGARNIFIRHGDGSYSLVNNELPETPVPAECDGECAVPPLVEDEVKFEGTTADLEHTLYLSNAIYNSETPREIIPLKHQNTSITLNYNFVFSLYSSSGGLVQLVSYLPNGKPEEEASGVTAGSGGNVEEEGRGQHVISENGDRIIFDADSNEGTTQEEGQAGDTEVYDRIDGSSTLELSGPTAGATPASSTAGSAKFWAASATGSRVFFTSEQELTSNSTATSGKPDLYVYEFPTEEATEGGLVDLTVDASEPAGVLGVLDASEEGEYVYFVAEGDLAAGATAGAANLYMVRNDAAPVFVATLNAGTDSRDWDAYAAELEAYVTPDGQHAQFMSTESLPTANFSGGYDNAGFSEVYEYNAPTAAEEANAETGSLVCGSCQSSGSAPTGNALTGGSFEESGKKSADTGFYHVRSLSDNGARMFFTSTPIESENFADLATESASRKVYEYESDGTGSCANAEGCIYLISSPTNTSPDYFLDASEEGEDVFFSTEGQLAATDDDQARDVYDATEYGEPIVAKPETKCESACHVPGPTVQTGPGLTSTLVGPAENAVSPTKTTKSTQKHKTTESKAQKLARALKKCKQKQSKKKRKLCEATARKLYQHKGTKAKTKSKQKRTKHTAHVKTTRGTK